MHEKPQQTYNWPLMAADVSSAAHDFARFAEKRQVRLRKLASYLKVFPAFEAMEPVTIDILGTLLKSRLNFQYIIVMADWFPTVVLVVSLRCIRSVDVAEAFSEHWVYALPKTVLLDNENQPTSKFFQSLYELLKDCLCVHLQVPLKDHWVGRRIQPVPDNHSALLC